MNRNGSPLNRPAPIFWRAMKLGFNLMPGHFIGMFLVDEIVAVLPLAGAILSRNMFTQVNNAYGGANYDKNAFILSLILYALYLAMMKLFSIYYQRVYVQFNAMPVFEKKVKTMLHMKSDRIGLYNFETPVFFNGIEEARLASVNIYRLLESTFLIGSIVTGFIVLSGFIYTIHPALIILILCAAVPSLLESFIEGTRRSKHQAQLVYLQRIEKEKRQCLQKSVYFKETRTYHSYETLKNSWYCDVANLQEFTNSIDKSVFSTNLLLELFKTLSSISIILLPLFLLYQSDITYGEFMTTLLTVSLLQSQTSRLFQTIGDFSKFNLWIKPFFTYMDIKEQPPIKPLTPNIQLKNISFRYPTRSENAIDGINFEIHRGEKIAIVGVNGAGKSTLAKILLNLLPPSSGEYLVDSNLMNGEASSYQYNHTSALFQDFCRYSMPLVDNITFGNSISSEKISNLIEMVGLRSDIPKFEILGREFGSTDLSGGEWQRVALARCFYKDAELCLLDEPTSAIDPLSEKELNDAIIRFAKDKTLIIISHRLSIARLMDRVYVLNNGSIVESGTHEDLLRNGQLYQRLWQAQLDWYKNE